MPNRRDLRIALPTYDAATAWLDQNPGGKLHLVTQALQDAGAEYLVRELLPPAPHPSTERSVVFWRDPHPIEAAARVLPALMGAGAAGLLCLPVAGSVARPCGWVIVDGCGIEGLDAVHVAGPGLRLIELDWGRAGTAVQPMAASRRLAGVKVALVGDAAALEVYTAELIHHGAEQLDLLAVEPGGAAEVDALAGRLGACTGACLTVHGCGALVIEAALSLARPEIVIGCEAGCGAAVRRWCATRLRVLVEAVRLQPKRFRPASTIVHAVLPAVPAAYRADSGAPAQHDLFGNLPIPPRPAFERQGGGIGAALRKHAARAAAQTAARIVRGDRPEPMLLSADGGPCRGQMQLRADSSDGTQAVVCVHAAAGFGDG